MKVLLQIIIIERLNLIKDSKIVSHGKTSLVHFNYETQKSIAIPEKAKDKLQKILI